MTNINETVAGLELALASASSMIERLTLERDIARDERAALWDELAESRENDRTAMGYLSAIRDALGFDGDYPALVAHCQEIAPQPPAVSAEPAMKVYEEITSDGEPDSPEEKLLLFCSIAMRGQDWIDAEKFFDALKPVPPAASAEPVGEVVWAGGRIGTLQEVKWRDHVCPKVGTKLYTAPPSADAKDDSEQAVNETNRILADHYMLIENGWMRAIDEAMVCSHLGVANSEDSYEDAKKKLNDLICWSVQAEKYLGADAKDAARYRWLLENPDRAASFFKHLGTSYISKEIDVAMQKGGA